MAKHVGTLWQTEKMCRQTWKVKLWFVQEKRSIPASHCLQQYFLSLTASSIDCVIANFSLVIGCLRWNVHMTSRSTLGLRADLNPPQINTMGCQPSGLCHRLHPLKPRPDPWCACVTAPALSTIWTRHPMLSCLLPSLLCTHHTRRWFSPSDIHGFTLFHAQIPGSGSHALIEIINTSDQGRLRFGCVPVAPVFHTLIKPVF